MPSLVTWLQTFELSAFAAALHGLGAEVLSDVVDLDAATLKGVGFTRHDLRQWRRALLATGLTPPEGLGFVAGDALPLRSEQTR